MNEKQTLQQVKKLIDQGDRVAAKRLVMQVIEVDPHSETAWLWLSALVGDPAEEKACLRRVLAINPRNKLARKHLRKLQSMVERIWSWTKIIVFALMDGGVSSLVTTIVAGFGFAFAGVPIMFSLLIGLVVGLIVVIGQVQDGKATLDCTGSVRLMRKSFTIAILEELMSGSKSKGYTSSPSSERLSSGYLRGDYYDYGATDNDIEFWGLDQPSAPSPDVAGWAVMDALDEMDADGDGFIDDSWW
jgi:type III secretory pathway component EscS